MYYDIKKIGARVAQLRHEKKLTQEQLAELVGIGSEVIGKLERGYRGTGTDNYILLAEFFNVSLDYLLLGRENSQGSDAQLEVLFTNIPEEKREIAKKILIGILQNI